LLILGKADRGSSFEQIEYCLELGSAASAAVGAAAAAVAAAVNE
jgi:hypothetical protein